jgi:hypothetical protein
VWNNHATSQNMTLPDKKMLKMAENGWNCWKWLKMAKDAENGCKRWKWLKMLEDNFRKLARNLEINSYKEIRKEIGGDLPDNLVWNNHATSQNMTLPDKKGQPGQASLERSASLRRVPYSGISRGRFFRRVHPWLLSMYYF